MATARQKSWSGMNWIRQEKRLAIYLRDGLACVYCGAALETGAQFSLDHLTPHSQGGNNQPTNLVTCCSRCNSSRRNRPIAEFAQATAGYGDRGGPPPRDAPSRPSADPFVRPDHPSGSARRICAAPHDPVSPVFALAAHP